MSYHKISLKSLAQFAYVYFYIITEPYTLVIEEDGDSIICDINCGELPSLLSRLAGRYVYKFTVYNGEHELHVELFPEDNE